MSGKTNAADEEVADAILMINTGWSYAELHETPESIVQIVAAYYRAAANKKSERRGR